MLILALGINNAKSQTRKDLKRQKLDSISIDNWRFCLYSHVPSKDTYGGGIEFNMPIRSFGSKPNNSLSFALNAGFLITPKSKYYSYAKNDSQNDFGVDTTLLYYNRIIHAPLSATFNYRLSIGLKSSVVFNFGLWGSYYSFDDWRTEAGYNNGNKRGNGGLLIGVAYRYSFQKDGNMGLRIGFEYSLIDNNGDGNGAYSRIGGLKIGLTF